MYQKMIDDFFRDNPSKDGFPSAAAMAHFFIKMAQNGEVRDKLHGMIDEVVFENRPDREADAIAEQALIDAADTGEKIVKLMRKGIDPTVQHVFVAKAVGFENEIVPDILRRIKTSLNTSFIELTVRVLSLCNLDVADEIVAMYPDVRSPYAQDMLLVTLGFKGDDNLIPWLIEQYHLLKKRYPDETYCEGARYAIWEIEERLYAKQEGGETLRIEAKELCGG